MIECKSLFPYFKIHKSYAGRIAEWVTDCLIIHRVQVRFLSSSPNGGLVVQWLTPNLNVWSVAV